MASDISVRSAQVGESGSLTALCVRSKAHWGYDEAFMRRSQASLTVSEAEIVDGRVLVAERQSLVFGVARVETDGELGARRMAILADPNAASFYERMGARFVSHAPSDAIPGRTLPLYEYDLTSKDPP